MEGLCRFRIWGLGSFGIYIGLRGLGLFDFGPTFWNSVSESEGANRLTPGSGLERRGFRA